MTQQQPKQVARQICGGWLRVCLTDGFQVDQEATDLVGRPITESEERAIFRAIDDVITELTGNK